MDRSDKFKNWLANLDEEKIAKLVALEKSVRLLVHVKDLVDEIDVKAFHSMARLSHQIKEEYEQGK